MANEESQLKFICPYCQGNNLERTEDINTKFKITSITEEHYVEEVIRRMLFTHYRCGSCYEPLCYDGHVVVDVDNLRKWLIANKP